MPRALGSDPLIPYASLVCRTVEASTTSSPDCSSGPQLPTSRKISDMNRYERIGGDRSVEQIDHRTPDAVSRATDRDTGTPPFDRGIQSTFESSNENQAIPQKVSRIRRERGGPRASSAKNKKLKLDQR